MNPSTDGFLRHFEIDPIKTDKNLLNIVIDNFLHFPYENLTKIIKYNRSDPKGVNYRLPDEILEDHLRWNSGGTCYSLTYYLLDILRDLQFDCYPVTADMNIGPDTHCAIIVVLGGEKYLLDPGYLINRPMRILPNDRTFFNTPINEVILMPLRDDESYELYTVEDGVTKRRYLLKTKPLQMHEFFAFWDKSFEMPMMNSIIITAFRNEGRIYVHNNHCRIITKEGKKNLKLKNDIEFNLENLFGISKDLVSEAGYIITRHKVKL